MVAPVFIAAPQITQDIAVGQTLSCACQLNYDVSSTITCSFQWVDGVGDVLQTDAPVATIAAGTSYFYGVDYYGLTSDNIGQTITCNVTVTNDDGSVTEASNTVGPVSDLILVTTPALSGDPIIGETLTCDNGAWTNDDSTITYQYAWESDSSSDTTGSDDTYLVNAGDFGGYITCQVFATDDTGTVEADSSSIGPVVTGEDVVNPTITTVSPFSALQGAEAVAVTITGTGFLNGIIPTFSDDSVTGGGLTFVSAESIIVSVYVADDAPIAYYVITLTNTDGGTVSVGGYFHVTGISTPTITSISPTSMAQGTTGDVVITGTGFDNSGDAFFAAIDADVGDTSPLGVETNTATFDSATQATVNITVPGDATLGTTDVTVYNPDGGLFDLPDAFTVVAAPSISVTGVSPTSLAQGATSGITVSGVGFVNGCFASFSGTGITVNSVTFDSSTSLGVDVTIADDAPTVVGNVTVTNPDSTTSTAIAVFHVTRTGSGGGVSGPIVSSVTVGSLLQGTSATLTIAGSGFVSGATVTMDGIGVTVNSSTFVSSTSMTVNVTIDSAATVGVSNVTVTNPDSGAGIGEGVFAVDPLNVFSLSAWRWVLSDPAVPESYTFEINPNAGGSLPLQKNLNIYQLTSDDGESVLYEGSDAPQLVVVSGTLLAEAQLNHLIYWYSKRRQIQLTDDLGRTVWVYFTVFTPTRAWSYQYPWRHTWTASFYVIGQQGVTTL